jgi:hypothetical protein
MKLRDAYDKAIAAGATIEEIRAEFEHAKRHRGTVPQRNMIRALQMMAWQNTKNDWVRLAGALAAQRRNR